MVIHVLIWFLILTSLLLHKLSALQTPLLSEGPEATMGQAESCDMILYVTIPSLSQGFVTRNSMSLSKQETEFLSTFSAKGKTIFTFQEALEFWKTPIRLRTHWADLCENAGFFGWRTAYT